MSNTDIKKHSKPLLRGYFHQEAFFVALGACALLIAKSSNVISLTAGIIYSLGLLLMFGISAIYHRPDWEPKSRAIMKRLDHSAIFILIAATTTPICMLALPEESGYRFLVLMWSTATAGIIQAVVWTKAPKYITTLFYIVMGWLVWPYTTEMGEALGPSQLSLIIAGGVVYTLGAIFYATKRPRLKPNVFGYHEAFHVFTIIGATLHFIVIYRLMN